VLVKIHDWSTEVWNSIKAHRKTTSSTASHPSQRLSRRRFMKENIREAAESARGNSDEIVFPFIEG